MILQDLSVGNIPTSICDLCLQSALTSYKYHQQCTQSQIILETYINQLNNETRTKINENDNITNDASGCSDFTICENQSKISSKSVVSETKECGMLRKNPRAVAMKCNKIGTPRTKSVKRINIKSYQNVNSAGETVRFFQASQFIHSFAILN